jgi:hypothetical protein
MLVNPYHAAAGKKLFDKSAKSAKVLTSLTLQGEVNIFHRSRQKP